MPGLSREEFPGAINSFLGYLSDYRRCAKGTIRAYGYDLQLFTRFLRLRHAQLTEPAEVTREIVVEYARELSGGPTTVRRRLSALGSFYKYLVITGQIASNPVYGIPLPQKNRPLPKALTLLELDALLLAAEKPWHRAALWLFCGTGIRATELAEIRLEDVDLQAATLRVHGKGNKERMVPLSTAVIRAIYQYLPYRHPWRTVDTLLVNDYGRPLTGRHLYQVVKSLVKRAGLEPKSGESPDPHAKSISPHCFRHTFATQLVRNGVDIRTVQELLGHAELSTTARYLAVDTNQKRAAVETLANSMQGRDVVYSSLHGREGGHHARDD